MSPPLGSSSNPSAGALSIFAKLKAAITPAQLLTIRDDVDRHLLQIQKLARKDEMTPLDLAEAVAGGLHVLLAELESFERAHQTEILGAALYFVSDEDELPDTASILGLDDDAAIFNHVARLVGRSDLQVEL